MANDYHDFVNRYGVRNIRAVGGYDRFDYYGHTATYYNDRTEMIEMELPRNAFDHLVKIDYRYDELVMDLRDEAYMRNKHPAINEAYSKYKMLLELYK